MNKKIYLIALALIISIGAFLFFQLKKDIRSDEASDVVIVNEKDAPDDGGHGHDHAPVAPSEPAARPSSGTAATASTPEEIQEELTDALEELPQTTEIKDLSEEEVHMTPEAVKKGGLLVGSLLDKAEKSPERREETLKFFLKCAEDDSVVPSVRAVCWSTLLKNIPKWQIFVPVSEARVPQEIKSLALKLR